MNLLPNISYNLNGTSNKKTVRPMLSDRCLSRLSCPVSNVGVLWPKGSMDQDAIWYGGRPRPRPHCVRWGPSSPSPPRKGAQQPQLFGARLSLLCRGRGFCAVVNYTHNLPSYILVAHTHKQACVRMARQRLNYRTFGNKLERRAVPLR